MFVILFDDNYLLKGSNSSSSFQTPQYHVPLVPDHFQALTKLFFYFSQHVHLFATLEHLLCCPSA